MKYKKIISVIILCLVVANFFVEIDQRALEFHQESFMRATTTFGIAKGLNGIISLLQGTELSVTPVGVGINFSIGEILDPLNDLVEQFSWVMLFASISLGIQKLLLILSAKVFIQVTLGLSALVLLSSLWLDKLRQHTIAVYALKSFLFLLVIRLSAVVFIFTSQAFYHNVLAVEYTQTQQELITAQTTLEEVRESTLKSTQNLKKGFLESVGDKYDAMANSINISKKLNALKQKMEEASINIINMMTLFLVQTLLMPLLYLWFLYSSIKVIFHRQFSLN